MRDATPSRDLPFASDAPFAGITQIRFDGCALSRRSTIRCAGTPCHFVKDNWIMAYRHSALRVFFNIMARWQVRDEGARTRTAAP